MGDWREAVTRRLHGAVGVRSWSDRQSIERAEVAEYRRLNGYSEDADCPENNVVPPGFAAVLTFRAVLRVLHDAQLQLPFDVNVHASQTLTWRIPMEVDSQFTTTARVGNVVARRSALFFDVATETRDDSGQLCCEGVATQALRYV